MCGLKALRRIRVGEEITVSYISDANLLLPVAQRPWGHRVYALSLSEGKPCFGVGNSPAAASAVPRWWTTRGP